MEQFLRDNRGTLPQEEQVSICLQIASGLLFLHQYDPQILHRDLTAKNILLSDNGRVVKISDLGQAKFRPADVQYLTTKAPGCVPYMPPECLVDNPHFTAKSDIFSFGVVVLQVATQHPPSSGLVNIGAIPEVKRREGDLARLPDDHPLKSTVLKCLKDDPAERPSCHQVCLSLFLAPHVHYPGVSECNCCIVLYPLQHNVGEDTGHWLPFNIHYFCVSFERVVVYSCENHII